MRSSGTPRSRSESRPWPKEWLGWGSSDPPSGLFRGALDDTRHRSMAQRSTGHRFHTRCVRLNLSEPHVRWGSYSPDFFGNLRERELFQATRVAVELADAFGELLRRHGIFVVHPAEGLLSEAYLLVLAGRSFGWVECALHRA